MPGGQGDDLAGPADGRVVSSVGGEVEVDLFAVRPPAPNLVVAGCDPAFGIVGRALNEDGRFEAAWWGMSSSAALESLASGAAHVAGTHLRDPDGGFTGARARRLVPFPCTRITFATWEQGLLVAPGNPKGIRGVEDLARPDVWLVNREPGSGSRALLDSRLEGAGIGVEAVRGYESSARGHLLVAGAVQAGVADVGVAISAAGAAFGLDVLPLEQERYELVIPDHFLDLPSIQGLIDVLNRPEVRAQVESLGGYDGSGMGKEAT